MTETKSISENACAAGEQLHRSVLRLLRLLQTERSNKNKLNKGQSNKDQLNWSKISILGRLYRDGRSTATDLAAYLRIQPQSLTRLIAGLKRDGLIIGQPNPADRRQTLLEITDTGVTLLMADIAGQRTLLARVIADTLTSTEQELLRLSAELIDRLAEGIEKEGGQGRDLP